MQQMGGLAITQHVVSLNDTFPPSRGHQCGRLMTTPLITSWCHFDARRRREIFFYLLSNHRCSSLITPSLPDAWGRHKKRSKSDSERSLRSGSRREKVFRCQGWEVEGPGSVGGSDEALLAVNEGWTDTLITPCNLRGANRWIFPFDKRDYKRSPGPDNRDLPCNVSTIDSGHKKKGWIRP